MRIMVVDTALGLCTAGVFEVGVFEVEGGAVRRLGLRSEPMVKGHSERIAGFARDAAAEAGVGFETLDRIGVTVGPGSFTGLRVGLAFAQGLAAALDRPVVGISALDALAASVGTASAGAASVGAAPEIAALIDARRGQVYARFWRGGEAGGPAEALSLEAAAERIGRMGAGAVLVGSGAGLFAGIAPEAIRLALDGPAPEALARLAAAADPVTAPARPLYLRAPDATPPTRLPGQARAATTAP